jgi:hypothetical protein
MKPIDLKILSYTATRLKFQPPTDAGDGFWNFDQFCIWEPCEDNNQKWELSTGVMSRMATRETPAEYDEVELGKFDTLRELLAEVGRLTVDQFVEASYEVEALAEEFKKDGQDYLD